MIKDLASTARDRELLRTVIVNPLHYSSTCSEHLVQNYADLITF